MRKEKTSITERLQEEATFGDLLEVSLRKECSSALHHQKEIIVGSLSKNDADEYGIVSICGYYGGVKSFDKQDNRLKEEMLCLNPTVHRADAIKELHYTGEGLIKVPLSAVVSYKILTSERRGLRVVN
ncbi:MAG: hypothetical protein AABX04_05755 [Nanoarchaeota archaeon]